MCGIVGYNGTKNAEDILVSGLTKLEYRGYDSSGIAIITDNAISIERCEGKLSGLVEKIKTNPLKGTVGIGHTRWATHGRPSEENAHPHLEGSVAVVHNGIIENYLELREELKKEGSTFKSETDTEILAHLINRELNKNEELKDKNNLEEAVRGALTHVKGTYALAVVSTNEPDKIIGARHECPMVLGLGDGEYILSSDITAILDITRRAIFIDDGEMVVLTKDSYKITDSKGNAVEKPVKEIDWSPVMAEKDGYPHFMLKEIFEQPKAVTDTFRGQIMEESGDIFFNDFSIDLNKIKKTYILGCGTSWHAGLVAKFMMEEFFPMPVEVDLASEFRYRKHLSDSETLVIAITQSGETADTLAAVKDAKKKGASILAITNVLESSIAREANHAIYTHAGPEIGVASTKAFTTQLTALLMFAIYAGRKTGLIDANHGVELIKDLLILPGKLQKFLDDTSNIETIAKKYFKHRDFLFLGRGINYPIALEGALKLKEISYIHAEGYPAGEMKHGPIALIDENMPVVVLAPNDKHYPKVLSNMEEVKARDGLVIAVVTEGDTEVTGKADDVITVPEVPEFLTPIMLTLPLQILSYHIAVLLDTDVDQPRNLAKSVTVE